MTKEELIKKYLDDKNYTNSIIGTVEITGDPYVKRIAPVTVASAMAQYQSEKVSEAIKEIDKNIKGWGRVKRDRSYAHNLADYQIEGLTKIKKLLEVKGE